MTQDVLSHLADLTAKVDAIETTLAEIQSHPAAPATVDLSPVTQAIAELRQHVVDATAAAPAAGADAAATGAGEAAGGADAGGAEGEASEK